MTLFKRWVQLLIYWTTWVFENKPDFSSLFCSEMVTKVLQLGDFLPSAINPSEQTPADVIAYDCFKERVQIK